MRRTIVTLGLAVAAIAVAIAAHAPLSRSTPVDARSAQGPTTALFMVLAGVGIVLLGAIVALVWLGRPRKDDPLMPEPRRIDLPWFWKLGMMLLTFALGAAVLAGAVVGAGTLQHVPRVESPVVGTGPVRGGSPGGTGHGFTVPPWLPWTVLGIVAIAAVAGVAALWLRRVRADAGADVPAAATGAAAVAAAIGALDAEGDPRRAVIAAYGAMQRTLGDHGVVRSPAEAPREYLERALLAGTAGERDVTTLTGLFEEARYSVHPIPERMREAALAALRALQAEVAR